MKRKISFIIATLLLVSALAINSSAIVFYEYGIPLNDNSTNTMYYELGIGQDLVRAETGVSASKTYTVYTNLTVWNSADTSTSIFDNEGETTTLRYVEIRFDYEDIYDIPIRARSSHIVEKNGYAVGWETVRKQSDGNGNWSDYSW